MWVWEQESRRDTHSKDLMWVWEQENKRNTQYKSELCTSQQKVDTFFCFYTSFSRHSTPYTVLESDNSESMQDVLH